MTENTQQLPPPQGQPFTDAQAPAPKKKMGKGKKAALWGAGILVGLGVIGSFGDDPAPTSAPAAAAVSSTTAATPDAAAQKAAADKAAAEKAAADKVAAEKAAAEKAAADKAAAEKAAAEKAAADKAAAAQAAADAMTKGQEQAVRKAESYLEFTAFSRKGLIEQLQFEGFSKSDATFAVDHIKADWMVQAGKKAESYLEMTSFSRSGLIDQLKFEGFTAAQAAHGADAVGL